MKVGSIALVAHFCCTQNIGTFRRYFSSSRMIPESMGPVTYVCVEQYLSEVAEAIDPLQKIKITDQYRKTMMRGLLNMKKTAFDEQMRQSRNAEELILSNDLLSRLPSTDLPPGFDDLAPCYAEGLSSQDQFFSSPAKLFSYMARGRHYKGRFEKVLADIDSSLLPLFESIRGEWDEQRRLKCFVKHSVADPELSSRLLECAEKEFPRSSRDDGAGQIRGKKGELSLEAFLSDREDQTENRLVLFNLFVKPKGRKGKQCSQTWLETSSGTLPEGMTNEFDGAVVELLEDSEQAILVEIWEAKAALHPITIEDALKKKYQSLERMFSENKMLLVMDGKEYRLDSQVPKLGIYGLGIFNPSAAARRLQVAAVEKLLERDSAAVLEALETGYLQAPSVQESLDQLLLLARAIKPLMFVSANKGNIT